MHPSFLLGQAAKFSILFFISYQKFCYERFFLKKLPPLSIIFWLTAACTSEPEPGFRSLPYLQNPAADAMTIVWFSEDNNPGQLIYKKQNLTTSDTVSSIPVLAKTLGYSTWEKETYFDGKAPAPPYRHRVRLMGLEASTKYFYTVLQGEGAFSAFFKTAPNPDQAVRFIVFADSETEPESAGKHTPWPDPMTNEARSYLVDQTTGFANNLEVIRTQQPDFVAIAGDLVESGGEQRDWDEFWRHLTRPENPPGLASQIPILAAPGNHEYYGGPEAGGYSQPASEKAINRFRIYFEFPANGSPNLQQEGRYFRLDYGPVTLILLDVVNDSPNGSENDPNFFLSGENDAGGGHAPAFGPGSRQYAWLENQLQESQNRSAFTFVILHHLPYSVGPHGWPAGEGAGFDAQSGVPVRTLTPLFMRYGVDAVFAGHDEMWERSEVAGIEIKPDGHQREHTIHFYDVGIGGDGLRGPEPGLDNPYQKFLAHKDAPEIWQDGVLISGGKHYGHLEVDVQQLPNAGWQAILKPVYVFPKFNKKEKKYDGCERRVYDDIITLTNEK